MNTAMQRSWKRRLFELGGLLAFVAIAGLIVVAVGVVPIKASSGHWDITRWFLEFASQRSVSFHSRGIDVPELDNEGMLRLGAATYESNCAWCHGSPTESAPPVAGGMTPHPPNLAEAVLDWNERELFYIVKHGIKFAGMPAWPTQQREAGIAPVVAFLNELPQMDEKQYMELVARHAVDDADKAIAGEAQPATVEHCAACHGLDGRSRAGALVPHINGQPKRYLEDSLKAYKSGQRPSGVMQPIASRLLDAEIRELSAYYAQQPRRGSADALESPSTPTELEVEDALELILNGDSDEKIPSCVDCHGPPPQAMENADSTASPVSNYPWLPGQHADYTAKQLELYANEIREGGRADVMIEIAQYLTPQQRIAIAAAYQRQDHDDATAK